MSLKVGKISGIEIRLHYSWFVIFALVTWSLATGYLPFEYSGQPEFFYWTVGAIAAGTLFLSVLVHEVAHSIVASRNKLAVPRITLFFFGGVSEISEEPKDASTELKMAASGPLSSLLIGITFVGAWFISMPVAPIGVKAILQYAGYINVLLAGFNMIPAFPMDGGRVLRALIWMRNGRFMAATRTATTVSHAFSYLFMAVGIVEMFFFSLFSGLWLLVIGLFVKGNADANLNQTVISQTLGNMRVKEIMTREVHSVGPDISIQQFVNSYMKEHKHRGFPVVSGGRLLGIVTDHDVRQVPVEYWDEKAVKDIMKPAEELVTVEPDDTASDAFMKMAREGVGRLPVLDGGNLVGIITRSDIVNVIQRVQRKAESSSDD